MSHEVARHWRLRDVRYHMQGERCPHCSGAIFPPRDLCPDCGKDAKEPLQMSGKGEIYSFAVVNEPPITHQAQAPYAIALVKLKEGPMVTAQLTDVAFEDIKIGMPVEMVTRKITEEGKKGQIIYGYKFRPPIETSIQKKAA